MTRALFEIARDLETHIVPLPASAVAYVKWLRYLEEIDDVVGETTGRIILRNLRIHLRGCSTAEAEVLKAELAGIADRNARAAIQGSGHFISQPAETCQLCGIDLAQHGKLVIGETVSGQADAVMCTPCHMFLGVGFGPEAGRLFSRRIDGRWEQLPVGDRIFTKPAKPRLVPSSRSGLAPWMIPPDTHPVFELVPAPLRKAVVSLLKWIGLNEDAILHLPAPWRKSVGRLLNRLGLKRLVVRNFFRNK